MRNLNLIAVVIGLLLPTLAAAQFLPHRRKAFRSSVTYLVNQGFEGTGYDNGETWTESGAGTIDEDSTGTVLVGSQSLALTASAQTTNTYASFTGQSTAYAYFLFRRAATTSHRCFSLRNSTGTSVCSVIVEAAGALTIRAGSAGGTTTVDATSTNTTYHIWVSYTKGTGANAAGTVAFSTTGIRPTSGNAFASVATGNATTDAARVMCGSDISATHTNIYDRVLVDLNQIGDNP